MNPRDSAPLNKLYVMLFVLTFLDITIKLFVV